MEKREIPRLLEGRSGYGIETPSLEMKPDMLEHLKASGKVTVTVGNPGGGGGAREGRQMFAMGRPAGVPPAEMELMLAQRDLAKAAMALATASIKTSLGLGDDSSIGLNGRGGLMQRIRSSSAGTVVNRGTLGKRRDRGKIGGGHKSNSNNEDIRRELDAELDGIARGGGGYIAKTKRPSSKGSNSKKWGKDATVEELDADLDDYISKRRQ